VSDAPPSGGEAAEGSSVARDVVGALDRCFSGAARLAAGNYTTSEWADDAAGCFDVAASWWSELLSCFSPSRGRLGGPPPPHQVVGLVDRPVRVPLIGGSQVTGQPPTASGFRGIGWGALIVPATVVSIQTTGGGLYADVTMDSQKLVPWLPPDAHNRTIIFEGVLFGANPTTPVSAPIRIAKPAYLG
jgi:hypothetical protein